MKDILSTNILFVNILLIAFWVGPILHVLHSKESFENKILNIIMMVIIPILGSLIYCVKYIINRIRKTNNLG